MQEKKRVDVFQYQTMLHVGCKETFSIYGCLGNAGGLARSVDEHLAEIRRCMRVRVRPFGLGRDGWVSFEAARPRLKSDDHGLWKNEQDPGLEGLEVRLVCACCRDRRCCG